MIVIIGKKAWVLEQIRKAACEFNTLGQWCQDRNKQRHTNQPLVLIQRNRDLH